jgi:hypothetical protein
MIKNYQRIYWLIALFIFVLAMPSLFADDKVSQKGLLWQITKPGLTQSYLFGTIHSEDHRVNKLPPIVYSRFKQAKSVSLELLMDIPTIMKSASAMFFTGEQSLDKILDKKLFAQVVKALQQYHMPPQMVKRLKPWAVMATLSTPPSQTGEFLDLLLYREAQQLQIPTYGLEKVEEQLQVFEGLSLDEQVTLLKETLKQADEMPKIFNKLHELYLQRDLTALMTYSIEYMQDGSDHKVLLDTFYERAIDNRNFKMVEKMEKRLQEGNAFIAVGALHLPGENGLLRLLQARGYRVLALY